MVSVCRQLEEELAMAAMGDATEGFGVLGVTRIRRVRYTSVSSVDIVSNPVHATASGSFSGIYERNFSAIPHKSIEASVSNACPYCVLGLTTLERSLMLITADHVLLVNLFGSIS